MSVGRDRTAQVAPAKSKAEAWDSRVST